MSGVIFVTHDLPVLRTVATQIAVMYQGRVVEGGRPTVIVDDPQHPYTKRCWLGAGARSRSTPRSGSKACADFDRESSRPPEVKPLMSGIFTAEI